MNNAKICGLSLAILVSLLLQSGAVGCTVCHSKNPKMVKMHKELEFKDCLNCHGIGDKRSPEDEKRLMASDQRCIRCHKKG